MGWTCAVASVEVEAAAPAVFASTTADPSPALKSIVTAVMLSVAWADEGGHDEARGAGGVVAGKQLRKPLFGKGLAQAVAAQQQPVAGHELPGPLLQLEDIAVGAHGVPTSDVVPAEVVGCESRDLGAFSSTA